MQCAFADASVDSLGFPRLHALQTMQLRLTHQLMHAAEKQNSRKRCRSFNPPYASSIGTVLGHTAAPGKHQHVLSAVHTLADASEQVHRLLRYYAEEAFSFLVRQHAPQAMRVLDMQDFHALRQGWG